MKIHTMAWTVGGAFLIALGGIGAVACSSSDDGTGTPSTGTDASAKADTSTNPGTDANVGQPDTSTPLTDAGPGAPDCGKPLKFFPVATGTGPFCPGSSNKALDAGNKTCAVNEHCCEHPVEAGVPSDCHATACATADPLADVDWSCTDRNSCSADGGGVVCCAVATVANTDQTCDTWRLSGLTATKCEQGAACATGELIVCQGDAQCPTGKTCKHISSRGATFGVCQ